MFTEASPGKSLECLFMLKRSAGVSLRVSSEEWNRKRNGKELRLYCTVHGDNTCSTNTGKYIPSPRGSAIRGRTTRLIQAQVPP